MLLLNNPKRNPLINLGAGLWDLYNNLTGLLSDVLPISVCSPSGFRAACWRWCSNTLAADSCPKGLGNRGPAADDDSDSADRSRHQPLHVDHLVVRASAGRLTFVEF